MFLRDPLVQLAGSERRGETHAGSPDRSDALTRRHRRCPTQQTPNAAEDRQPRRSPVLRTGQLQESDSPVSVADLSAIRSLKLFGLGAALLGGPGVLDLLGVDLVRRCRECLLTAGRWVAVCRVSWSGLPTTMRSCRPGLARGAGGTHREPGPERSARRRDTPTAAPRQRTGRPRHAAAHPNPRDVGDVGWQQKVGHVSDAEPRTPWLRRIP
jgi:hypothetical protein